MNYVLVMHNALMEFHFFSKTKLVKVCFASVSFGGSCDVFDALYLANSRNLQNQQTSVKSVVHSIIATPTHASLCLG